MVARRDTSHTPMPGDPISTIVMRKASSTRWNGADDPRTIEFSRQLATAKIAKCITEVIAGAPDLHPEQIETLVSLLRVEK